MVITGPMGTADLMVITGPMGTGDLMETTGLIEIMGLMVVADPMVAQCGRALTARFQAIETGAAIMGTIIP